MITHISEKESQLTAMLTTCTDALNAVTAERDALRAAAQAGLDALSVYEGEDSSTAITQLQAALKGKS